MQMRTSRKYFRLPCNHHVDVSKNLYSSRFRKFVMKCYNFNASRPMETKMQYSYIDNSFTYFCCLYSFLRPVGTVYNIYMKGSVCLFPQGASGGAVVMDNGVVSFGSPDQPCDIGHTRVTYYLAWIQATSGVAILPQMEAERFKINFSFRLLFPFIQYLIIKSTVTTFLFIHGFQCLDYP